MKKKRFLFPWQTEFTLTCPHCNEKIQTLPLWPWESVEDKIRELQPSFCHRIDPSLMRQAPVLTENDVKSKSKFGEFGREMFDEHGELRPYETAKPLFDARNGPPEIFLKHGIFPLLYFFREAELTVLYLFLCLDPTQLAFQQLFLRARFISRAYVSTILKKLVAWKLVDSHRANVKGRARGRQLCYDLSDAARQRLDKDLLEFDFFRETVRKIVRPIALSFPRIPWRKDLGLLEREDK
jgi:hypothetical protein